MQAQRIGNHHVVEFCGFFSCHLPLCVSVFVSVLVDFRMTALPVLVHFKQLN